MNEEKIDTILEANQLLIRDRNFYTNEFEERAKIIDQRITELLNPKQETPLRELTYDAFHEQDEVEDE